MKSGEIRKPRQDRLARGLARLAPRPRGCLDRRRGGQPGGERTAGQNRKETPLQRNLAGKRWGQADRPLAVVIGNRQRQDRSPGFNGRLQQGGMKAEQLRAVGGRAFGKEGDIPAGVQQRVDFGVDDARMTAAAAAKINRIVALGEPTDERPLADLRLGDEALRMLIQIGDLIWSG